MRDQIIAHVLRRLADVLDPPACAQAAPESLAALDAAARQARAAAEITKAVGRP